MFVSRTAVVGAGVMGGEIAYSIAAAGFPVVLKDVDAAQLDRGTASARRCADALVGAGKLTAEERDRQLHRIVPVTSYERFGDVDFVVEAVPERVELKREVFAELDAVTPGQAILASNTSGLSITEIADATIRPDRVVGFHYFYPASRARLIEVVEGEFTSAETVQEAVNFAQAIRKAPVRCADLPGFVVNRVLLAGLSEAWRYAEETGAGPQQVDEAIAATGASPIGPYRLADILGLDTVLHVAEHLEENLGDRFFVSSDLRDRVAAGRLGRKSGEGFFPHG